MWIPCGLGPRSGLSLTRSLAESTWRAFLFQPLRTHRECYVFSESNQEASLSPLVVSILPLREI